MFFVNCQQLVSLLILLTEDTLFPKRKASGALLREILEERQKKKIIRDMEINSIMPALALKFQRPI